MECNFSAQLSVSRSYRDFSASGNLRQKLQTSHEEYSFQIHMFPWSWVNIDRRDGNSVERDRYFRLVQIWYLFNNFSHYLISHFIILHVVNVILVFSFGVYIRYEITCRYTCMKRNSALRKYLLAENRVANILGWKYMCTLITINSRNCMRDIRNVDYDYGINVCAFLYARN